MSEFVTRGTLELILAKMGRAVGQGISRKVQPISTRLAAVEVKVGAIAMLSTRGPDAAKALAAAEDSLRPLLDAQRGMLERIDKQAARIADLEARIATLKNV